MKEVRTRTRSSHPGGLTHADAVVLFMLKQSVPKKWGSSPQITQDGIAHALGCSRAHASMVCKDLMEKGLLDCANVKTKGSSRLRKSYYLTPRGLINASDKERALESKGLKIADVVDLRPFSLSPGKVDFTPRSESAKKSIVASLKHLKNGENGHSLRKLTKAIDHLSYEIEGKK